MLKVVVVRILTVMMDFIKVGCWSDYGQMADFIMVEIVVLVMEKMMLGVAMTDTMLSIWIY